jgi:hypothetical protein
MSYGFFKDEQFVRGAYQQIQRSLPCLRTSTPALHRKMACKVSMDLIQSEVAVFLELWEGDVAILQPCLKRVRSGDLKNNFWSKVSS